MVEIFSRGAARLAIEHISSEPSVVAIEWLVSHGQGEVDLGNAPVIREPLCWVFQGFVHMSDLYECLALIMTGG